MAVAVLGGGIAGLSAAYYLKRGRTENGCPIHVIEADDRTGGWIRSWRSENADRITELGPRTIRGRGKSANNTYRLIKDLGIEDLVCNVGVDSASRYIYAVGNIHKLPTNVLRALFTVNRPFTKPWIYYVLRECFSSKNVKRPEDNSDESAYNFFCRTYGPEFADYLISPLLCGICGGNSKEMSVQFMFGALYEAERKHGSVGIGLLKEALHSYWNRKTVKNTETDIPPSIYYLKGGLQGLIDALHIENESRGVQINLNTRCTSLRFHEDCNGATVKFSDGQQLECSHVISALPAHKLASLFCSNPQHLALTQLLTSIPMVSIATVNLSYDDPNAISSYKGFGVLASPMEQLSLLGIIFNNYIYGHSDCVDLTVMMGGYGFKEHFVKNSKCMSEEKLTNIAIDHVQRVLNIKSKPNSHSIRVLHNCIPQYTVGHYDRVVKIQEYIAGKRLPLTLVGSSFAGISINDVIFASMTAVRKLCKK